MFGFLVRVRGDGASLRDALVQLSKAYESRAMHSQSMLRGWVAPVSIVLVGLVIAVLILSMFLPLISIINAVSG
jgi:type II secretory pathway component PulF